jgi:hypothetical protein
VNGILAQDVTVDKFPFIILGDSFMRAYHSYFDKNNDKVGFCDAKIT